MLGDFQMPLSGWIIGRMDSRLPLKWQKQPLSSSEVCASVVDLAIDYLFTFVVYYIVV